MEKNFRSQLDFELNIRLFETSSQRKPLAEVQFTSTMLNSMHESIIQYALKCHAQFNGSHTIEFSNKQDFSTFCEYVISILIS